MSDALANRLITTKQLENEYLKVNEGLLEQITKLDERERDSATTIK